VTPARPIAFGAIGDLWVINVGAPNTIDLRISRDGGHTWTQAPALDPVFPPQLEYSWQIIRTKGRILLAYFVDQAVLPHATPGTGMGLTRVLRLSPNADRWEDITPCPCRISFDRSFGSDYEDILAVYAVPGRGAGQAELLVTMDAGTTWSFRPLPTEGSPMYVSGGAVVMDLFAQETLFSARFLDSTDAGLSWRSVGDGLPTYPPGDLFKAPKLYGIAEDSLLLYKPTGTPQTDLYRCSLR
jgi:hypothetical protein